MKHQSLLAKCIPRATAITCNSTIRGRTRIIIIIIGVIDVIDVIVIVKDNKTLVAELHPQREST